MVLYLVTLICNQKSVLIYKNLFYMKILRFLIVDWLHFIG